jgi:hypothetical protein
MWRSAIAGVAAVALLVGCGDDGGDATSETTEPDATAPETTEPDAAAPETTEPEQASLSGVCTDLTGALDQLEADVGDIDSLDDLTTFDDALGDAVDRVEDAARRLDDVDAQDEDEQEVVDALDQASSSARRIDDELRDGEFDRAREELEAAGDALDDARQRAADADIDCSA